MYTRDALQRLAEPTNQGSSNIDEAGLLRELRAVAELHAARLRIALKQNARGLRWIDGHMSIRTFTSRHTKEVWLSAHSRDWARLPIELKRSFADSLERLAVIRAAISRDALVKSMPPVEIVAACWRSPGGIMPAQATILSVGGRPVAGVQIAAPTALCDDDALIRAVLVHEFSHCFRLVQKVIRDVDAGATKIDDSHDVCDAAADDERLGNPSDWFSREDVEQLIHHNDRRMDILSGVLSRIAPFLKTVYPETRFHADSLYFEEDVARRAREIIAADYRNARSLAE